MELQSQTDSSNWTDWLRKNLCIGKNRDLQLVAWSMLAIAAGFLAYTSRMHEVTHDAFHEMALFRQALVQGDVPQHDVFAYTATVDPSVHHEWGTGAILYFVTIGTGLGPLGLTALRLLLIAALWLLMYRVARMRGAHPIIFFLLASATFPVFWVGFATVRAQLFTLVCIAAQLWMQELDWRGRRAWVLGWLCMLVFWLNVHAGFVVGLGLIAFHSIERFLSAAFHSRSIVAAVSKTWHLIAAAPAAVMVLPLNPYGWNYITYLIDAIRMPRPLIKEWQPIWNTYSPVLTLGMLALCIGLFVYSHRVLKLRRLKGATFLALCFYMTIKHIRHGSILAVVWIAYVPAWISRTRLGKNLVHVVDQHRTFTIRACQGVAATSLLFAACNHFWMPSLPPRPLHSTACFPTDAVEFLKDNNFNGNLLTPFHIGAYVSWEMYPNVKVSFDGRYEVAYQANVMPEHNQFLGAEDNWWELLDNYPNDAALVHKQAPVAEKLDLWRRDDRSIDSPRAPTKPDWYIAYEDDSFIVLASPESNLPQVDRRGEELQDGAWEAFSSAHAHWHTRFTPTLAGR